MFKVGFVGFLKSRRKVLFTGLQIMYLQELSHLTGYYKYPKYKILKCLFRSSPHVYRILFPPKERSAAVNIFTVVTDAPHEIDAQTSKSY